MNIGKSVSTRAQASRRYKAHSDGMRTLKKVTNGANMKKKKEITYKVETTISYLNADSGSYEKINKELFHAYGDSPTEALLWCTIQSVDQANPILSGTCMRLARACMYLQLYKMYKELSSMFAQDLGDNLTFLSIYQGALDGIQDFTRESKLSKMDWFTILDITPK